MQNAKLFFAGNQNCDQGGNTEFHFQYYIKYFAECQEIFRFFSVGKCKKLENVYKIY